MRTALVGGDGEWVALLLAQWEPACAPRRTLVALAFAGLTIGMRRNAIQQRFIQRAKRARALERRRTRAGQDFSDTEIAVGAPSWPAGDAVRNRLQRFGKKVRRPTWGVWAASDGALILPWGWKRSWMRAAGKAYGERLSGT